MNCLVLDINNKKFQYFQNIKNPLRSSLEHNSFHGLYTLRLEYATLREHTNHTQKHSKKIQMGGKDACVREGIRVVNACASVRFSRKSGKSMREYESAFVRATTRYEFHIL